MESIQNYMEIIKWHSMGLICMPLGVDPYAIRAGRDVAIMF